VIASVLQLLRPLPLSIGVMGLLIVCKLAALVQGPDAPSALQTAGRAFVPMAYAAPSHEPKGHDAKGAGAPKPGVGAAPPAEPVPGLVVPSEPPPSEAERSLLLDLRSRRKELDGRAQSVEQREALLAAAERRMAERLNELSVLQTRLELLENTRRDRDEANWRGMVKTYETMRPRDAATIFNDLDQAVLIQVLDRMKEAKAAPILAAMQPDRARVATTELVKWRSRPPAETAP
jgi:flagellar motility protein MotE (MotC chaperone)